MTGHGHCDDRVMEHCDERHGMCDRSWSIVMKGPWSIVMTGSWSIVMTVVMEHCDERIMEQL